MGSWFGENISLLDIKEARGDQYDHYHKINQNFFNIDHISVIFSPASSNYLGLHNI